MQVRQSPRRPTADLRPPGSGACHARSRLPNVSGKESGTAAARSARAQKCAADASDGLPGWQ
eukprot:4114271-Pyramimonas_sp.AAC.1